MWENTEYTCDQANKDKVWFKSTTVDLCFCRGKTFLFLSYASSNKSKLENPLHLSRCDLKQIFTCKEKAHQGEHNQFFFQRLMDCPKNQVKDQMMRWDQTDM